MNYSKQVIITNNGTVVIHKPLLSEIEKEIREQEFLEALEIFKKEKKNVSNKSD